jgi:pyridoxine/pyridoxamine 5'-phosphate oxidase
MGASTDADVAWAEVLALVARERTVWLATVRSDGTPHVAPVWAVVVDETPWFWTSPESAKGRNLARRPSCALHVADSDLVAILDGEARRDDADDVRRAYAAAYGQSPDAGGYWRVDIRTGRAWRGHGGDAQVGLTIFER